MSEFKIEGGDRKSPIRVSIDPDWIPEALIIAGAIIVFHPTYHSWGWGLLVFGFFWGLITRR